MPQMSLITEEMIARQPPQAQAIYAKGDAAMFAVLTTPNANISQLLSTFASQANSILANAQQ